MPRQRKDRPPLTAERLRSLLLYESDTGHFRWRLKRHRCREGGVAGHVSHYGYIVVGIDGYAYSAQRLVWLYTHGRFPVCQIDHINGRRSDNRLANLREASMTDQRANSKRRKDNSTGFKGVYLHRCGRFAAQIVKDQKHHFLGLFDAAEQAHAAYCEAAERLFGEFARHA